MARIYPRTLPPATASEAERLLFDAFHTGLDSGYRVIHSLPWLTRDERRLGEGECDFMVLHPRHGLLAVEAKSVEIRYDGRSRAWLRGDHEVDDPFQQAQRSVHAIDALLRRKSGAWARAGLPFGHAVAVPHAERVTGAFPAHVRPEILLLRGDLDAMQERVEEILAIQRSSVSVGPAAPGLDAEGMEEVIRVLLPEFRVVHSLGAALDAENEALHRLTSEQIAFFEGLSGNRRLLVDGVAGSGKTVLARETAKRLAAEGARVLLCCFNIPLAETLREQLEGAERIDVVHFHGLCERVVTATGGRWEVPPPPNSTFFNETAAELLLDALPGYPERYDALVVDEGQDFQEAWWVALVQLLRDPAAGHVIVFHDPRQNIYGRSGAPSLEAIPYTLTVNCRNTVAIARVVHAIGRVRARTSVGAAEGEAPVVREVADDAAEREAVRKILDELVNRGGLPTRRIVILGAHKFERSPFAENAKLGRFTVRDMSAEGRPDGSPEDGEAVIRYCTLHRFKGLEEDCVILGGIGMKGWQPTMPELYRAMLYVAASRARVRLFLLHRPGSGLGEMMRGDAGTL